jgi:hypothetical protein
MDFITSLPKSEGKEVIFVVVDRFSKYAHFMALSHHYSATTVAKTFMDYVYKLHGIPATIVMIETPFSLVSFGRNYSPYKGSTSITSPPTIPNLMTKQKWSTDA